MKNKFDDFLQSLSEILDTDLEIDQNRACNIVYDNKISVQLELDDTEQNLIVFSSICPIPPGKFRENVLLEALKENDKYPYIATFGYYSNDNSLAIFNFLDFINLDLETFSSYLSTFVEYAFIYVDAIEQGQTAPILKPS